jgi:hypothetical protein
MSQGDPARQQALADQHHQHLDADGLQLHGASYSQQQQQGSQDIAPPQLDMLSQQLHQVLVADTTRFWSATVGPSAQSIFQVSTTAVLFRQPWGAGQRHLTWLLATMPCMLLDTSIFAQPSSCSAFGHPHAPRPPCAGHMRPAF